MDVEYERSSTAAVKNRLLTSGEPGADSEVAVDPFSVRSNFDWMCEIFETDAIANTHE